MSNANSTLIPMVKKRINYLKHKDGLFNINTVAQYAKSLGFVFDSDEAEAREIARFCRQIAASYVDKDGDRVLVATGRNGEYLDRLICKDTDKFIDAMEQPTKIRNKLDRLVKKMERQVEGQLSFYPLPSSEVVGDRL